MDPTTLVSRDRVESAGELLKRLPAEGLVTRGALWSRVEGDGQPYLYIITPNAEHEGQIEANLRLGRALREFQKGVTDLFRRLDPYEIKLIGPSDPLAQGVLDLYQEWPDDRPTYHQGSVLGTVSIDGAYIYPAKMFAPPPPLAQPA